MTESSTSNGGRRVIVLSPDAAADRRQLAQLEHAGIQCIRVATGYEAAAELIAAPSIALVIDLRLLGPRHLRLLQIARDLSVEMLAVGAVPPSMTPEDLSGLRLMSREALSGQLLAVAAAAANGIAATPVPPSEQDETAPSHAASPTSHADQEPHAAMESPSPVPAAPRDEAATNGIYEPQSAPAAAPSVAAAAPVTPAATDAKPSQPVSPRLLLTPEEISALLETDR